MSGRIKIVRVLSNPAKRKAAKKRRRRRTAKPTPRRAPARRSSGTKFFLAMRGNSIYYIDRSEHMTGDRRGAARFANAKLAAAAMKKWAPVCRKRGVRLLQIVAE